MIIKITRGASAARCLAYDYGPGRRQDHHNPRRVTGSVPGRDWRARSRAMQAALRDGGDTRAGGPARVYRLACRAAPGDRILSDREWAAIAGKVVERFTGDAANHAFEVVRHDRDHVHITLLQRGHDGRLFKTAYDYQRAGRIAAQIEAEHDLIRVDHTPVRGDPARRKGIRARDKAARETWRGRAAEARADDRAAAQEMSAPTPAERLAAARVRAERNAAAREARQQRERERDRGGRER